MINNMLKIIKILFITLHQIIITAFLQLMIKSLLLTIRGISRTGPISKSRIKPSTEINTKVKKIASKKNSTGSNYRSKHQTQFTRSFIRNKNFNSSSPIHVSLRKARTKGSKEPKEHYIENIRVPEKKSIKNLFDSTITLDEKIKKILITNTPKFDSKKPTTLNMSTIAPNHNMTFIRLNHSKQSTIDFNYQTNTQFTLPHLRKLNKSDNLSNTRAPSPLGIYKSKSPPKHRPHPSGKAAPNSSLRTSVYDNTLFMGDKSKILSNIPYEKANTSFDQIEMRSATKYVPKRTKYFSNVTGYLTNQVGRQSFTMGEYTINQLI